ncbi:MAG: hypothetical protein FD189_366 [Elusimicrobia bacterium]|nr:MAG: hypothetical protein FD154_446 [Elusimicrobiota bacterium]KAF0157845.1 MAG: hypothetical protein FD189_366 [Elusimicrobiota bacterium]
MQEHANNHVQSTETSRRKGYRVVFLLAFTAAVLFEALLFMHTQAREILAMLEDDFRVVVLLKDGGRKERDVLWESIRALQGVRSAVFISKGERLARMREEDPELIKGALSLGPNPLPDSYEIAVDQSILSSLNSWTELLWGMDGVAEVRYKQLEAYALLHFSFYDNFIALAFGLALLGAVLFSLTVLLHRFSPAGRRAPGTDCGQSRPDPAGLMEGIRKDKRWFLSGAGGAAAAVLACYLIVYPVRYLSPVWAWPNPLWHLAGVLAAGFLAWTMVQWKNSR